MKQFITPDMFKTKNETDTELIQKCINNLEENQIIILIRDYNINTAISFKDVKVNNIIIYGNNFQFRLLRSVNILFDLQNNNNHKIYIKDLKILCPSSYNESIFVLDSSNNLYLNNIIIRGYFETFIKQIENINNNNGYVFINKIEIKNNYLIKNNNVSLFIFYSNNFYINNFNIIATNEKIFNFYNLLSINNIIMQNGKINLTINNITENILSSECSIINFNTLILMGKIIFNNIEFNAHNYMTNNLLTEELNFDINFPLEFYNCKFINKTPNNIERTINYIIGNNFNNCNFEMEENSFPIQFISNTINFNNCIFNDSYGIPFYFNPNVYFNKVLYNSKALNNFGYPYLEKIYINNSNIITENFLNENNYNVTAYNSNFETTQFFSNNTIEKLKLINCNINSTIKNILKPAANKCLYKNTFYNEQKLVSYTNLVPISTVSPASNQIFNKNGYIENYYITTTNNSWNEASKNQKLVSTGFIKMFFGNNIIYISGIELPQEQERVRLYITGGTKSYYLNYINTNNEWCYKNNANNTIQKYFKIEQLGKKYYKISSLFSDFNFEDNTYFRITGYGLGEDFIVTINEPIE